MSLVSVIEAEFNVFGVQLAQDLKTSAVQALADGGRRNVNTIKLDFNSNVLIQGETITLTISAVNGSRGVDYWKYIETGRRPGARNIPADVVGKKWQNQNNIDPRRVLADMRAKKGLKAPKKALNFDKAAKALSFIIQRSIKRKGIKPKPYVDRVIDDGRMEAFALKMRELVSKNIILIVEDIT